MSNFIEPSKRSFELPLGCKDLAEVQAIRDWQPIADPDWLMPATDKLALMESYLTRLLRQAGKSPLVSIGRSLDCGNVMVIRNDIFPIPVVLVTWDGAVQEQAIHIAFEDMDVLPITEAIGRWNIGRALKYPLPSDPVIAAQFIATVFRAGLGLGDSAPINMWPPKKSHLKSNLPGHA